MASEDVYSTKEQEKTSPSQIEKNGGHESATEVLSSTSEGSNDTVPTLGREELRRTRRKADYRLVLWYSFVYLIMRIDVSNISNTAIINKEQGDGIKKQLGNLSSEQWAWALSIF